MTAFDTAFDRVIGVEGGYSNNPADSGGETKYGITIRVAREFGYVGPMQDLPLAVAKAIYKDRYWDLLRLDYISALSLSISVELFDTAVNTGVATAGKFLQRALNALNKGGKDYPDVVVDGIIGPSTCASLKTYLGKWGNDGVVVLLRVLNGLQVAHYVDLVEKRPKDEAFLRGWILQRVEI